jgi:hypothetical protein
MFVPGCKDNAAATTTARHNTQKMTGTNRLKTMLMATGIDGQFWEEAITIGRRETPMTTTTALPMEEEKVMTMTTVTEAFHVFVLRCSGRGAGRG